MGVLQKNGKRLIVTHEKVKFVLELWINSFSIRKSLKNGFNISNNKEILSLIKRNVSLIFDNIVKTKDGWVPAMRLMPVLNDVGLATVESGKSDTIDVNNLHRILDHCGRICARLTGKALGFEATGKFNTCDACSIGKARQKNVNK